MSLAYETSEETVSPFRYMVGLERVELSSSDYKSLALTVVLQTYGCDARTRTLKHRAPETRVLPIELHRNKISRTQLQCDTSAVTPAEPRTPRKTKFHFS